MVVGRRGSAAQDDCDKARGRVAWMRAGLLAVAGLALAIVGSGEAAAQCIPGGFTPCYTDATTGNTAVAGQAALMDMGSQFLQRAGAIASYRNAASPNNNPQGGGADGPEQRYRTWLEGYGVSSRTDAEGTFTGDRRKTGGITAGVGATVAPGLNLGLTVDQSHTKIDIVNAPQNGRLDLTQIGAIASYDNGPWSFGATYVQGFASVHTSRFDGVGKSTAAYNATLSGAMAEASYYWSLPDNTRIVPKLSFDWTHSRTDQFTETGGATPVTGSAVSATRARMLVGAEFGHSWLADRTIMDFLVYAKFVDNMVQNFGSLVVNDTSGANVPSVVAGVRESTLGADSGATLSAKLSDSWRVYAVYDGRFRSNFTSHTGTIGAEYKF